MPSRFRPIRGRKIQLPRNVLPQARAELTRFQREGLSLVSQYPPQQQTKSGYRRSGSLLRSWSRESGVSGGARRLEARIISSGGIAPYNVYVVGPARGRKGERQTAEMRRRGWPAAPDVLADLWDQEYVPRFQRLLGPGS